MDKVDKFKLGLPPIIIFEGPDKCGKTEIAHALANKLGYEYFRSPSQEAMWRGVKPVIDKKLSDEPVYVKDWIANKRRIVMDRSYISEFVYSKVFNRYTNHLLLSECDDVYSDAGTCVILCIKDKYKAFEDEYVPEKKLGELRKRYGDVLLWTKCKITVVHTEDENLERELREIMQFLKQK